MTHISDPPAPEVPAAASPVYAFNTDSMQGIGLAIDLANAGATVYRATEAFDFGGRHYDTGAGLVDGASIALADLAAKALARDTPVYGLPRFVAPRKAIAKPKIAMWTGGTDDHRRTRSTARTARRRPTTAGRASRSSRRTGSRASSSSA